MADEQDIVSRPAQGKRMPLIGIKFSALHAPYM